MSSDMLRGRVVVLASWATWCLPCRWELPEIERAYERFRGDQHVAFYAVDRGSAEETPARAKRYFEKSRISVPLPFEDPDFAQAFGDGALPMVVVLDKQGRTRLVHHAYDASEHFDQIVGRTVDQVLAKRGR